MWLPDGEKISKTCMFIRFDIIHKRDRHTHRQAHTHTHTHRERERERERDRMTA